MGCDGASYLGDSRTGYHRRSLRSWLATRGALRALIDAACYSLAQESRIESRIASRGNCPLGGCQTSKNVALTRDDALAKLRRVSITAAHNMVRQCSASCGNLGPLEALQHVVCLHFHPAALLFKFFLQADAPAVLFLA
jgi:hypothetical protein